ncbi:MAG: 3-isopropylmalate dehydrogenase [Chloroflexota bacterium]
MTYRIGVIAGDGIGPEVVQEGLKVLSRAGRLSGFQYELTTYPWNSRLYLDTGELMPSSALDEFRQLDAIFLGALGDPRVERGLVERSVIMQLRLGLDLYINLRPVALPAAHLTPLKDIGPDDLNMVVVRENTEDAYVGIGGSLRPGEADEVAIAEMIYSRRGVERAIRYAFELARSRNNKRKLTLVDKSNAIRAQEIWRRTFADVALEYPDVETEALYVDAAVMHMVANPGRFDVIVTTNLFGDIITDLGAVLQGGMGTAASGNIHPGKVSVFEPIHGSAPDIAGQNKASPIGAISAISMLLAHVGEADASRMVDEAVRDVLVRDEAGLTTEQVGDEVAEAMERVASAKA